MFLRKINYPPFHLQSQAIYEIDHVRFGTYGYPRRTFKVLKKSRFQRAGAEAFFSSQHWEAWEGHPDRQYDARYGNWRFVAKTDAAKKWLKSAYLD